MSLTPKQIKEAKEYILNKISVGKSLNSLVSKEGIPSHQTVYNWLNEDHKDYDKVFLDNYVRARETQADYYADQIIEIADKTKDPHKARVQIDARKWVSSKLKPKKYSDKIDVTSDHKPLETSKIELTYNKKKIDLSE